MRNAQHDHLNVPSCSLILRKSQWIIKGNVVKKLKKKQYVVIPYQSKEELKRMRDDDR